MGELLELIPVLECPLDSIPSAAMAAIAGTSGAASLALSVQHGAATFRFEGAALSFDSSALPTAELTFTAVVAPSPPSPPSPLSPPPALPFSVGGYVTFNRTTEAYALPDGTASGATEYIFGPSDVSFAALIRLQDTSSDAQAIASIRGLGCGEVSLQVGVAWYMVLRLAGRVWRGTRCCALQVGCRVVHGTARRARMVRIDAYGEAGDAHGFAADAETGHIWAEGRVQNEAAAHRSHARPPGHPALR